MKNFNNKYSSSKNITDSSSLRPSPSVHYTFNKDSPISCLVIGSRIGTVLVRDSKPTYNNILETTFGGVPVDQIEGKRSVENGCGIFYLLRGSKNSFSRFKFKSCRIIRKV